MPCGDGLCGDRRVRVRLSIGTSGGAGGLAPGALLHGAPASLRRIRKRGKALFNLAADASVVVGQKEPDVQEVLWPPRHQLEQDQIGGVRHGQGEALQLQPGPPPDNVTAFVNEVQGR